MYATSEAIVAGSVKSDGDLTVSAARAPPSGASTVEAIPASGEAALAIDQTTIITRAAIEPIAQVDVATATVTVSASRAVTWRVAGGTALASAGAGSSLRHRLYLEAGSATLADGGEMVSIPLVGLASIGIAGGALDDVLALAGVLPVPARFDGGAGDDTLYGPPVADLTWTVTGPGSGYVAGLSFTGVENLVGASDNRDTFVFQAGAIVSGWVDGGAGGFDSLVLEGSYQTVVSAPADAHSGLLVLDGTPLFYTGLEPVDIGTSGNVIYELGTHDDTLTLEPAAAESHLTLSGSFTESFYFDVPNLSLTIRGGDGVDLVTLLGAIALGSASLTIEAEKIYLPAGASITTTGDVTFNAYARSPTPSTLTAEVVVEGAIGSEAAPAGAVTISAKTEQTFTAPTDLGEAEDNVDVVDTFASTANAEIKGTGASVHAASLSLTAETNTSFTATADANITSVYDASFNHPSLEVAITNSTHAGVSGGASVTVADDATGYIAINATDTTNVSVHITDPGTAAIYAPLGGSMGESFGFSRLGISTAISRDTQAFATSATLVAGGDVQVWAQNTGAVTLEVASDFVGAGMNEVTKDDAVAAVTGGSITAASVEVNAKSDPSYTVRTKESTNDVTGSTKATVSGGAVLQATSAGVKVSARDDSSLSAVSNFLISIPGTAFIALTFPRAENIVHHATEASVAGSTITAKGDLDIWAVGNASAVANTAAVTVTDTAAYFEEYSAFVVLPSTIDIGVAGTLAFNVITGGVSALLTGSTVHAANVDVDARTEEAVVDATSQVSAVAGDADGTALASASLSIGASLALNFLGWDVDNTLGDIALATVDALLGTDFAGADTSWLVQAKIGGQSTVGTTDAKVAAVTVSADSKPLVNSTISNMAPANTGHAMVGAAAGAADVILATNKVSSAAEASIEDSTVRATGGVSVLSSDDAGIYSNAKIVASSVVASDGGVHYAQQGVNYLLDADYTSDQGSQTLAFGDRVRLADDFGKPYDTATRLGTQTKTVSPDDRVLLDGDYGVAKLTSASGIRLITRGDVVGVDEGYEGGGDPGVAYRYLGASKRLDLAGQDYADTSLWAPVGGTPGSVYAYAGATAASLDLNSQDYSDSSRWTELGGVPSSVYEWMGPNGTSVALGAPAHPYSDLGWWKPVPTTQAFPEGLSVTPTPSAAIGALIVVNDVRSSVHALVDDSTVDAASLTITGVEQAVIRATADSTTKSVGTTSIKGSNLSLAVNAVITTNRILSEAFARIVDSTVTTAAGGDVEVDASNLSQIDATTQSATTSDSLAVGVQLAFNTIGWLPTNIFFAALDALLGDPTIQGALGGEQPAKTEATVTGSSIQAGGNIYVSAVNGAAIFALVGNEATSAPAAMFSAKGASVGAILASSMVSSAARAFIDGAGIGGAAIGAGGSVSVSATDAAQISAATRMSAVVSPTNDMGAGILNQWAGLLLNTYDYTSNSGVIPNLLFGKRVRVADDYTQPTTVIDAAFDPLGKTFEWMGGTDNSFNVNLGTQDYSDYELWKEITPTTAITDSLSYALLGQLGNKLNKDGLLGGSKSYYGLIDHNDVRSVVEAYIEDIPVTAGGSVSVVANDSAVISASEDSSIEAWDGIGGIIAVNAVLSSADARLTRAPVTAGGDLLVDAQHLAQIDASTTSHMEGWTAYSLVVAFNSIGWIPTNIFFTAADVLTAATDYLYDYTSNDRPLILYGPDAAPHGDDVRVDSGPHAGQIFEYLGQTLSGPVDLSPEVQDYDGALWKQASPSLGAFFKYLSTDTPATVKAGNRVKIIGGGYDGQVFKYIGETDLTSPDLAPYDVASHPLGQDYDDTDLWLNSTLAFGGQKPSHALAVVVDSPLTVAGSITVNATSGAQLNAVVGNDNVAEAALDIVFGGAGQQETKATANSSGQIAGYGASGAAGGIVVASNRVSSFARAAILFTGAKGAVKADGTVNVTAHDTAGIDSHSTIVQSAVASNTLAGLVDIVNNVLKPTSYKFTTASGEQWIYPGTDPLKLLFTGPRVRIGQSYIAAHPGTSVVAGDIYVYVGAAGARLNFATQNYATDTANWARLVMDENTIESFYPGLGNFTNSDARAVGVLIVYNDLRSDVDAGITNAAITSRAGGAAGAVTVAAVEDAMLLADALINVTASGGSFWGTGTTVAGSGQLVTNVALAGATAWIADSTVHAASLWVTATSTSGIDATILSATQTGADGYGFTLAFNTLGWKAQNVLFNALEALLGDPLNQALGGERPAMSDASIRNSDVTTTSTGDASVWVAADNAAKINATVSNAARSDASPIWGQTGKAIGGILASNKVSSRAYATVDDSTITAGGDVAVTAWDDAGIYANVKIVSSSITTNNGGAGILQGEINNFVPADYLSSEGTRTLKFGDRVRLGTDFGAPTHTTGDDGTQAVDLATGDVVELHSGYGAYRLTTASGIRLLALGDNVLVEDGYQGGGDWGVVYRYVGPGGRIDLAGQDYRDTSLWRPLGGNPGSVYKYVGAGEQLDLNSTDYTDTTRWQELGGTPGSVYEWMGPSGTPVILGAPEHPYSDLGWWKPVPITNVVPQGFNFTSSDSMGVGGIVVLNDVMSDVEAQIYYSAVTAHDLLVQAREQAVIRALTDATVISSGGSSWDGTGQSLAVNAVIATNRVLSGARAFIDALNSHTVTTTGTVRVEASNASQLDATTLAATSSTNQAVGILLAFNTIGWKPTDLFFAAIDALLGDPLISSAFKGQDPAETLAYVQRTNLAVGGNLDIVAWTDARINALVSNSATSAPSAVFGAAGMSASFILASNMVLAEAKAYLEGTPGYSAADVTGNVTVSAADEAAITADTKMYAEVSPTNDAGAGIINGLVGLLLDSYQYTSNSGEQDLVFGDRVRVADDADEGVAGQTFEWMGTDELGAGVDLGTQDYTDFELWKQLTPTNLVTGSLSYALLGEIGCLMGKEGTTGSSQAYFGLIDHNDVRSTVDAHVKNIDLLAASLGVWATGGGYLSASDTSVIVPWEGYGAVIVTNVVLSTTDAYVEGGSLGTSQEPIGDVTVTAANVAQIDATSTSRIEAWTAVSAVLAFNSIGWKASNLLFNAVDALLGDPLISSAFNGEQPAHALAYIRNTPIHSTGDVTVTADDAAQLNAVAGNENVAEAAVDLLFMSAGQKGDKKSKDKSKQTDGYGASGLAGGAILASNKVSSYAKAFIEFTGGANGVVDADGAVVVWAEDRSGIDAQSTVVQSAITTNDLSGIADIVNGFIIPGDYDYSTASGEQYLGGGELVRLGSSYAGGGDTGSVYRYVGDPFATTFTLPLVPAQVNVLPGDTVRVPVGYLGGGQGGRVYEFVGTEAEGASLALNTTDYSGALWKPISYSAASLGSQSVTLHTGDTVVLPFNWLLGGDAGALYEYIGSDGSGVDINAANYADAALWQPAYLVHLDLGTVDYTDDANWDKLVGGADNLENLYPGIGNFTDSDARAVGILIVMNDLRSDVEAYVRNVDLDARSLDVTALENALLKASGLLNVVAMGGSCYGSGTVLAVGGQIATNVVLAAADAFIAISDVTTTGGGVTVTAKNTSGIDARILSATTSSGDGYGLTLAFNTVGWKSQNLLFNTVDALLGDPLIAEALGGEKPAKAVAYVVDTDVSSAGGLRVTADNAAQLNATLSNAATSQASALYGAKGKAIGGLLASNKVSAWAEAWVGHPDSYVATGTGAQVVDVAPGMAVRLDSTYGTADLTAATSGSQPVVLTAPADVLIPAGYGTASYAAGASGSQAVTLTDPTNVTLAAGYGVPQYLAIAFMAPQVVLVQPGARVLLAPFYGIQARYETGSGTQALKKGDTVLVSAGYAGGGKPGKTYKYLGDDATLNLAAQNYGYESLWAKTWLKATYTSGSGSQALAAGDTVRITDGYTGFGVAGAVYRYMGTPGTRNVGEQNYILTAWTLVGGVPGGTYQYVGGTATLDLNGQDYAHSSVWRKVGGAPGGTYRYVGSTSASLDLNVQDYTDPDVWQRVTGTAGATYRYVQPTTTYNARTTGKQLVDVLPGQTVRLPSAWSNGGTAGAAYRFVGTEDQGLGSDDKGIDLNAENYESNGLWKVVRTDLNAQDYANTKLWSKLGGTPGTAYRYVGTALSGVAIDVNATDYSDATRWTPYVDVGRVTIDVAGDMLVQAKDSAGIYANVRMVSSSTTIGDGGMPVMQQEINNFIPADYLSSEGERTITFGQRVRIAPDFITEDFTTDQANPVVAIANGQNVRVADGYGDSQFTTDSGKRLLIAGDTVEVLDGYTKGGTAGTVYRYTGANARLDLAAQDYSKTTLWAPVAGVSGAVYKYVGDDGTLDLGLQDYTDTGLWKPMGGVPGSVYEFLGVEETLDLSTVDYTDLDWWKPVAETQLLPQGMDVSESDTIAVGGLVVLNDVRGGAIAYVKSADVDAASLTIQAVEQSVLRAIADATVTSSGGGSFEQKGGKSIAVSAVIATNVVLSEARAALIDSDVKTDTGDVVVDAFDISQIDATTKNASQSAGQTVGVTLAFNTIGWRSQNFIFNGIDVLLGDPLIAGALDNRDPAHVEARITNSKVDSAGDVCVSALNEAVINAEVTNEASSIVVMVTGSEGFAAGFVIASNMINVQTRSAIELVLSDDRLRTSSPPPSELRPGMVLDVAPTVVYEYVGGPRAPPSGSDWAQQDLTANPADWLRIGVVEADGSVIVSGEEGAEIDADVTLKALAQAVSDLGLSLVTGLLNAALVDYGYTTKSGTRELAPGELVRVASDYAYDNDGDGLVEAVPGGVYAYDGPTATYDVGDFATTHDVIAGNTVLLPLYWLGKGEPGVMYSYKGTTTLSGADLKTIDYTNTNLWVVAPSTTSLDLGAQDYDHGPWTRIYIGEAISWLVDNGVSFDKTKATAIGGIAVRNDVRGDVTSTIVRQALTAGTGVSVTSLETATITADDLSSVIAQGTSSQAVNGLISTNLVLSGAKASIEDSAIATTAGNVIVDAQNTSTITAEITSETEAHQVAIGFTVAFNTVGWDSQNILFNLADAILGLDIGNENPVSTSASVGGSTISAGGGVAVTATTDAFIDAHIGTSANTFSTSLSDSSSYAVSVAPVVAMNKVSTETQAVIKDAPAITGKPSIEAKNGNLEVVATDGASILSFVEAPVTAVAASAGNATGVSVAISISRNDVRTATDAKVASVPLATATGGEIVVSASETASIDATSRASAVTIAVSMKGSTAFSGGGATAVNAIRGHANATVSGSSLEAAGTPGTIEITTENASTIAATVKALAVSIAASTDTSVAVAIGFSLARNFIGWTEYGGPVPFEVKATTPSTQLKAAGGITASAASTATINAVVEATSVAVAVGKTGVSLSAGGLWTDNKVAMDIEAGLGSSTGISTTSGAISVSAGDTSSIVADAQAAAVSASLAAGDTAVALSIGLSLAHNTIDNDVAASIKDASSVTTGDGDVTVTVTQGATIKAKSIAVAVSAAMSLGTGVSLAGGASESTNIILSKATASIEDSTVGLAANTVGDVSVTATSTSTIEATVAAVAAAVAFGATTGVGVALGISVARNFIGSDPTYAPAYDNLSAEHPTTLSSGKQVKVVEGDYAGGVFKYVGTADLSEPDLREKSSENADGQDYSIRSLWQPAGSDYLSIERPTSLPADAIVRIVRGARAGDVYQYIGKALPGWVDLYEQNYGDEDAWTKTALDTAKYKSGSRPATLVAGDTVKVTHGPFKGDVYEYKGDLVVGVVPLCDMDYSDYNMWKQVGFAPVPAATSLAGVQASIVDSSVNATGDLTVSAQGRETIDAVVIAGAVAISGGGTTGVGASGAGVFTQNKIRSDVKAFIDGDGSTSQVSAKSITVTADDASGIRAIAGAAAIAMSFAGTAAVSVSIGLSIALNEVANDVAAYVKDVPTVKATGGNIDIAATSIGRQLFKSAGAPFNLATVTAADLDDAANADSPDGGDAADDRTILGKIDDEFRAAGFELQPGVAFTSGSGTKTLARGDKVVVSKGYALCTLDGTDPCGIPGKTYIYIGTPGSVALSTQDYSDETTWSPAFGLPIYFATGAGYMDRGESVWAIPSSTYGGTWGRAYTFIGENGTWVDFSEEILTDTTRWTPWAGDAAYSSGSGSRALNNGDTVRVTTGYSGSGTARLVYRFVGTSETTVNVGAADYTDTATWERVLPVVSVVEAGRSWQVVAGNDVYLVTKVQNGQATELQVSRATIDAVSVAAAVAVAASLNVGVAVSGAGAVAQNVVLTKVNAYLENSTVAQAANVYLAASSTSSVSAIVAAFSAAVGIGIGAAGVAASIGVSLAWNYIGSRPFVDEAIPAEVQAYSKTSSIEASGALSIDALANQSIDALVLAGSAAIAGGAYAGVAVSGAGVSSDNRIVTHVKAFIDGDGATGIRAARIALNAKDTSSIIATAGAVSLAAGFGLAGVAVSIGVTMARNTIEDQVEAYIANADTGVTTTSASDGDIVVATSGAASIAALAAAASVAVGGGLAGVGVSGAGAQATNVIL
ncbi:MAG: hypothetical protein M0Z98_03915, partial [Actinomycetales bacterium]|nr:hypothetical protein [Actinomycetales bacterium]